MKFIQLLLYYFYVLNNHDKNKIQNKIKSKSKSLANEKFKYRSSNKIKLRSLLSTLNKFSIKNKLSNKSQASNKNKLSSHIKISSKLLSKLLSTSSKAGILTRGWFKYIEIISSKKTQDFEVNPDYKSEISRIPEDEMGKRDEVGQLTIPDEKSFYMVLTQNTLNILTSRRNQVTKTYNVLDLNIVQDITEDAQEDGSVLYNGGIQSMGEFDEGTCFKLKLKNGRSYIICHPMAKVTAQVMGYVYRMWLAKKEGQKHEFDEEVTKDTNFVIDNPNFDMGAYVQEELEGKDHANPFDLGDWSVCDKVCDGGTQVKFVGGCGKPMGGFRCSKGMNKDLKKLSRKCNVHPCPDGMSKEEKMSPTPGYQFKQQAITLPLSLESHYVSHRYQQYEECKIKDEDLCIRRADLVWKMGIKGRNAPILPGRAVLNNKTFSFYENTKFDSLHRSFTLDSLDVSMFGLDADCFEVKSRYDQKDSLVLCGCPFEPNAKDVPQTWVKEIQKFRDFCPNHYGNAVHLLDNQSVALKYGNEVINVSGDKLKALAKSALEGNASKKEREEEEKEAVKISDALNQVQTMTASLSKNEFFKAKVMEKEETLRNKKELEKMDRMIQREREKERCITTVLEREARRAARKHAEMDAEQELTEIKKEVQEQVKEVKKVFSAKLSRMRQDFERAKMEKMKELTDYKLRITGMLIDQQSKGTAANCKQDKPDAREAYCNARFPVSWFENKHCRQVENFCGVCCQKEYSVKYADEQQKCTYECNVSNGLIEKKDSNNNAENDLDNVNVEIINNP